MVASRRLSQQQALYCDIGELESFYPRWPNLFEEDPRSLQLRSALLAWMPQRCEYTVQTCSKVSQRRVKRFQSCLSEFHNCAIVAPMNSTEPHDFDLTHLHSNVFHRPSKVFPRCVSTSVLGRPSLVRRAPEFFSMRRTFAMALRQGLVTPSQRVPSVLLLPPRN